MNASIKALIVLSMLLSTTALGVVFGYLDAAFFEKYSWLLLTATIMSWFVVGIGLLVGRRPGNKKPNNPYLH